MQKRRTIRESTKKLKSNGFRGSTSAGTLVRTPDSSLTLSVGSFPQRPIYPSESSNPWPRAPSAENLTNLPPPPVYREATRLSKEDLRLANSKSMETAALVNDRKVLSPNLLMDDANESEDEEIPPPVPPHRSLRERPKSAMSIDEPVNVR